MDNVAAEMLAAVCDINARIEVLVRQLDLASLPSIGLDDLIPVKISR